ncbi:unnamed protein product [Chrysodeixis includens]|uniref:Salivary secreted peptide n=1 Tax=Chrysodeixis includens TaxID=689277 RepID=A0A9P0BZG9_CHRIL|nr:unnamed protein product [Chrysodeixis includens]
MKTILLITVLAVLSLSNDAAVVQQRFARYNLVLGSASAGDRLLYRNYFSKGAIPNAVQTQDITYRGNRTTRISAIRALEVGYTQYANAFLVAGGIGGNNATIRLQSARGYGYYYQVEFYGR